MRGPTTTGSGPVAGHRTEPPDVWTEAPALTGTGPTFRGRSGPSGTVCEDRVGATIVGNTLAVACEGSNQALYTSSVTIPGSGLPAATHLSSLGTPSGEKLAAGPSVAVVVGH